MAKSEEKANELMRAYARALRAMKKEGLVSTAKSAGFVPDPGDEESWTKPKGKRKWAQVFVLVIKGSDERLKKYPMTGGLRARL